MAIVSRFSVEKAASVKKVAKRTLTQRLRQRVGISDSSDSSESSDDEESTSRREASAKDCKEVSKGVSWADDSEKEPTIQGDDTTESNNAEKEVQGTSITTKNGVRAKRRRQRRNADLEAGRVDETETSGNTKDKQKIRLPKQGTGLEQNMPADALLTKKDAKDFLQVIDPAIMPLGIITLEDVLEGRVRLLLVVTISDINPLELIGEEIYDEFDFEAANGTISSFVPSEHASTKKFPETETFPTAAPRINDVFPTRSPVLRPLNTRGLSFLRSTSAPPSPRTRDRTPSFSVPIPAAQLNPQSAGNPTATTVGSPETTIATPSDEPKARGENTEESASENVSDPGMLRLAPPKKRPTSSSGTVSPLVSSMSPAASRSASPAPSLEAILLDRKRRLAAAAAAGKDVGPMIAPSGTSENYDPRVPALRASTMSPKGTKKFKSSPLGGGEQTGVILAEKVKRDIKDQEQDTRIPGEMDKAAPDRKEDDSGYL